MHIYHLVSCSQPTILLQLCEANHHHTALAIMCANLYGVYAVQVVYTWYKKKSTIGLDSQLRPKCSTHQCKQAASLSCSLEQPLCTRTLHLGFVGSFGR